MLSNSISSQFSPIISLQVVADIMMDAQLLKVCEADNIAVNKGSDKTVLQ